VKNVAAFGLDSAFAVGKKHHFIGHADAALKFVRIACMKISGECPATGSPGSARIAGLRTDLEISRG